MGQIIPQEDGVKKSAFLGLAALAGLSLLLSSGCKKNPHDNAREPEPWTDKPVENHHFDGGESDPYGRSDKSGGEGGDKAAPAGE
jgi:hypothetical protein